MMLVGLPSMANVGNVTSIVPLDPASITGLKGWYEADSLSLSDGDPVSTWTDSSGEGNDATQSTGGFKPTFKTSIINGLPVLRWAGGGSTNFMSVASMPGAPTTATTVFIVQKRNNTATGVQALLSLAPSSTNAFNIFLPYTDNNIYFDFGDITGTARISGAWGGNFTDFFVWTFIAGGGNMGVYRNGATVASSGGHTNSFSPGGLTLSINGQASGAQDADIAEIVIYNVRLSDIQRGGVELYLADKYGL